MLWSTLKKELNYLPEPKAAHCSEKIGNKIYFFGGWNGRTALNILDVFDLDLEKWKIIETEGQIPSIRNNHAICVYQENIYIHGGHDGEKWLDDFFVYNTKTNNWQEIILESYKPKARACHTISRIGRCIYLYGGFDGKESFGNVEVFDLQTHLWKFLKEIDTYFLDENCVNSNDSDVDININLSGINNNEDVDHGNKNDFSITNSNFNFKIRNSIHNKSFVIKKQNNFNLSNVKNIKEKDHEFLLNKYDRSVKEEIKYNNDNNNKNYYKDLSKEKEENFIKENKDINININLQEKQKTINNNFTPLNSFIIPTNQINKNQIKNSPYLNKNFLNCSDIRKNLKSPIKLNDKLVVNNIYNYNTEKKNIEKNKNKETLKNINMKINNLIPFNESCRSLKEKFTNKNLQLNFAKFSDKKEKDSLLLSPNETDSNNSKFINVNFNSKSLNKTIENKNNFPYNEINYLENYERKYSYSNEDSNSNNSINESLQLNNNNISNLPKANKNIFFNEEIKQTKNLFKISLADFSLNNNINKENKNTFQQKNLLDNFNNNNNNNNNNKNSNKIISNNSKTLTFLKWKKIKTQKPPSPRNAHSATVIEKFIFIFGGHYKNLHLNDLIIYDTKKNQWLIPKLFGNTPNGLRGHTSNSIFNNFYIFGGYDGKNRVNDLYRFSLEDFVFTKIPNNREIIYPRQRHTGNVVNNKIYFFGGFEGIKLINNLDILNIDQLENFLLKEKSKKILKKDFQLILNDKTFSDIKFVVINDSNNSNNNNNNNKIIFAHKIILSHRVEYFKNMFSEHMIEKNCEVMEIYDYDFNIFFEFLNYVYSSEICEKKFEVFFELFKMADHYTFEPLRKYCENLLSVSLKINNVFDVLILGYRCNSLLLEKVCVEFICLNRKKASFFKEEINNLIEYPILMARIMQSLASENI